MNNGIPKWVDVILIPLLSLILAFVVSGLVVLSIGKDPIQAIKLMVYGAFRLNDGIGPTLYYTTSFIFTGLAVAVAFHAKLFNIGGEGQAAMAGVGVTLIMLAFDWPHWTIALLVGTLAAAIFGAAWAAIPAYLQVKRGSHIVITTIMFNLIAGSVIAYLLVGPLQANGSLPESSRFPSAAALPTLHDIFGVVGINFDKFSDANITFFMALLAAVFVWLLIWKSRLGYEIRVFGNSDKAAVYAGISPVKITMIIMLISGALAGLMAVNTVQGQAERLVLGAVEGAGFIGIAVALMGRNHPVGIVLAAFLFGALTQGGVELQFEMQIPAQMVIVIQALIIMFTGSLENLVRMPVERLFTRMKKRAA
ncbi:MAG: ABC transporter permease [Rhodobacteraceae bacterium]|nr:ABC transporter permease [Paracoccaceae bacterium]